MLYAYSDLVIPWETHKHTGLFCPSMDRLSGLLGH